MTLGFRRVVICMFFAFAASTPALAEPRQVESLRSDGSSIHWTLDLPGNDGQYGVMVLAQGSGCLSVTRNKNLINTRTVFGEFTAISVEKYGVLPDDAPPDDHLDCSSEFREHHTVSQRVADYKQVIESLQDVSWWNGNLVLLGGSEGGLAMSVLASEVEANAVILISTAGGIPFGQMVRQSIPEEGWPTVDAAFDRARLNPESSELWAGQSLRFWADIIDKRPADYMLSSSARFLLIQGGRDASGSVGAARTTSDLFCGRRQM